MELKKVNNSGNQLMFDRCSVKRYNPNHPISKDVLKDIIQDALTAPSSLNLQPWHFVVVNTDEMKDKIRPHLMFNKTQAETSVAFIVIYANLQSIDNCDEIYKVSFEKGLIDPTKLGIKVDRIKDYYSERSEQDSLVTAVFDCGLVSMQLMLAARAYGYDTNPIGGFEKNKVSEILGVDLKKYKPLLLLSIGQADEKYHNSIRLSVDQVTDWK